jgi:hypothetical protein
MMARVGAIRPPADEVDVARVDQERSGFHGMGGLQRRFFGY